MSQFTLEFLPHYSGGLERKADFSLYEATWNNYGRWGLFECQINLPIDVPFKRVAPNGSGSSQTLISDIEFSDNRSQWTHKRLYLSDKYNGQVLSELPDGIFSIPSDWFLLRLILAFSKEDREVIKKMFHFSFHGKNKDLVQTFLNEDNVNRILKEYRNHFF